MKPLNRCLFWRTTPSDPADRATARHVFAAVLALALFLPCAAPAQTRVEITKDNSIVLYPGEYHLNAGQKDRIRIKGNQHLVALAFDTSGLKDRTIKSATLVYPKADEQIDYVTLSTIQCPWDEAKSTALTAGKARINGWGREGVMFPAVTGGNAFSLVCHAKSVIKNGAYHWTVHPDLLHACVVGAAYGITVHEASSDYSRNPTVWSRESRSKKPYLLVQTSGRAPAPVRPTQLRVHQGGDPGSIRISLTAPTRGLAYDVRVNGGTVPRWNIPFVTPGKTQVIALRDVKLASGQALTVTVNTINRSCRRSPDAIVRTRAPTVTPMRFPAVPAIPPQGGIITGLSVIPIEDRYDERGKPIGDLPDNYRVRNSVFNGRSIRLSAARGEVVGFQVLIRGKGRITARCNIPGIRTESFKALYVNTPKGRVPDPLVPFDHIELTPNQDTPVCVDVYVPFDYASRQVTGSLVLSDGRQISITLKVHPFALPRKATFLCEMNSYGLPDTVKEFYRLQEIAYDHRVHCNILHYSHRTAAPGARKCNMDMRMDNGQRMNEKKYNDIKPGAKTTYWDDFIKTFGPYLSGEYFKDGHRGKIPAPGFYLSFHESWPLNVRGYFDGNPDAYQAFASKPVYAQTFVNILRDFIRIAKREGWTQTGFQVYLNNKGKLNDPSRSPWILDEPTAYWDYRALAYYGDLVRKAKGPSCPIALDYRIDISRPQFDRGELHGKSNLWVVNTGSFRTYPRIIQDRAQFTGETMWIYGTSNKPEASNRMILAWVLEAYRNGARGVVPWQTVNKDGSALTKGNALGLFIFDKSANSKEPMIHHSMRLKAYRRAEQDVEYLELVGRKHKLTREQLVSFMDHYVPLSGEIVKKNEADAGTMRYDKLSPENFRKLRAAAAAMLSR